MHAHLEAPVSDAVAGGTAVSEFTITAMNCNNCARHVTEATQSVPGVGGARGFRGAWNRLKRGSSNMDTLVALGSSTAFGYSFWGLFRGGHGHLYFMEAASIITIVSAGHFMETVVSARAASSLRS